MNYEEKRKKELEEARKWYKEHKEEIEKLTKNEINGKDVVSLESLKGTKEEVYDPFNF